MYLITSDGRWNSKSISGIKVALIKTLNLQMPYECCSSSSKRLLDWVAYRWEYVEV